MYGRVATYTHPIGEHTFLPPSIATQPMVGGNISSSVASSMRADTWMCVDLHGKRAGAQWMLPNCTIRKHRVTLCRHRLGNGPERREERPFFGLQMLTLCKLFANSGLYRVDEIKKGIKKSFEIIVECSMVHWCINAM